MKIQLIFFLLSIIYTVVIGDSDCVPQNVSISLSSLSSRLLLTAVWRTNVFCFQIFIKKSDCVQEMRYRKIGTIDYAMKPASSHKVNEKFQHSATVTVDNEKYEFTFGKDPVLSDPILYNFDASANFEAYIISDINPQDPTAFEIITNIKNHFSSNTAKNGLKILIDLGGSLTNQIF